MGHVDDTHRAIGDRETQRHQEKNRAKAQADEQDFKHSSNLIASVYRA